MQRLSDVYESARVNIPLRRFPEPMRIDHARAVREDEVWLLIDDGEPVGAVHAALHADHALVHGVAVRRDCRGRGRLFDEKTLELAVPRGVGDGTLIELSLARLGIENLWLRIQVRIDRR